MADEIIIIKRQPGSHDDHHGGSWKVAFADFAIALMAMFLVLWLVAATNPVQKQAIADYFSNPGLYQKLSSSSPIEMKGATSIIQGAPTPLKPSPTGMTGFELSGEGAPGIDATVGMALLAGKKAAEGESCSKNTAITGYALQIRLLPKAVLLRIVQSDKGPVFAQGSAVVTPFYEDLFIALAPVLAELPGKLIISGHADTTLQNTKKKQQTGNWQLSGKRAEAVRDILVHSGLPEDRVFQIAAMGASQPLTGYSADNPLNRRVEILVLTHKAERLLKKQFQMTDQQPDVVPEMVMNSALKKASDNHYRARQ